MKLKLFATILTLFFVSSCDESGMIWMSIDPIQCLGNDWEQAWLEENGNNYELWVELSADEQMEIFKAFFEDEGVIIQDIDVTYPYEEVCQACSCPRGDRIHILIEAIHLEQMLDWGFDLE